MSPDCTVGDLEVTAALDHTYVGDLIFTLEGPSTTQITLMDQPGSGMNSADLSQTYPVTFGDVTRSFGVDDVYINSY